MINYLSNKKSDNPIKKITVISDPLFSINSKGDVDGFFAINYTNMIRKYSVFSNILEKNTDIVSSLNIPQALQNSLSVNIYRVETIKDKQIESLIYNSDRAIDGHYFEERSLNSKQMNEGYKNKPIEIGFLNVLDVDKNLLNTNDRYTLLEFYNFTDMDYKKKPETKYKYKIEIQMIDPVFDYLNQSITAIENVLSGGGIAVGLEEILSYVKTIKSKKSIQDNLTLVKYIQKKDTENPTQSIILTNNRYQLTALRALFIDNNILSLFGIDSPTASKIYSAVNNILSLDNFNNISIKLLNLLISKFTFMKNNLNSKINTISNLNVTNQNFGIKESGISSINGNSSKRVIFESITSKEYVKTLQYGFNYLSKFKSMDGMGLKQVSNSDYILQANRSLARYYNTQEPESFSASLREYINNFLYSSMLLAQDGVVLPEKLIKDIKSEDWTQIFKILLLFIKQDASNKIINIETIYKQGEEFLKELEANIDVELINSLDRSRKQLAQKGLRMVPKTIANLKDFIEADDEIQTDQIAGDRSVSNTEFSMTNSTDYFSSFINNLQENKNTNNSLKQINDTIVNNEIPSIESQSVPAICLIEYNNEVRTSFGNPEPGVDFKKYYENRVWSTKSGELFLDRYAEFFFNFINTVKVEYLYGFDTYTFENILNNEKTLDTLNNINVNSYTFKQLTNSTVEELETGKVLLCKLVDHIPEAFFKTNRSLSSKFKFFKKYYSYFLIIKGPRDLQIKRFGSSF